MLSTDLDGPREPSNLGKSTAEREMKRKVRTKM